jgi:DNA repair exonuclease SbcCD ATPase subunit
LDRQIKNYEETAQDLTKVEDKIKLYKSLVEAYGPRGLRLEKLRKIAKAIETNIIRFLVLFTEKDFEFLVSPDESSVRFMVRRTWRAGKNHKANRVLEYDVRQLSGGEKKRLSVALILTLASLVASTKRTNLVILDEIETNLDDLGQYTFINDILPLIRGMYETVIVIAHSSGFKHSAIYDQQWKVIKENGRSQLEYNDEV